MKERTRVLLRCLVVIIFSLLLLGVVRHNLICRLLCRDNCKCGCKNGVIVSQSDEIVSNTDTEALVTPTEIEPEPEPEEITESPDIIKADHQAPYYIVVYTGSQSLVVFGKDENGLYTVVVKVLNCSTGTLEKPTKTGMYRVKSKFKWRALVGHVYGYYSSGIGNDYLFHSVPYKKKAPSMLNDEEYDKLGSPASHGCIRLCVRDSKWIYDNVPIGTQVRIMDAEGPEGEPIPPRNPDPKYKGWDPSDEWSKGNPYFK